MTVRIAAVVLALAVVGGALWFGFGPGAGPAVGACTAAATAEPPPPPAITGNPPAVRWERATLPDGLDDAGEQVMLDVAAFGGGFVAVGRSSVAGGASHAFLLHSVDGRSWEVVSADTRFADAEVSRLTVVGTRLFGTGSVSIDDRGGSRAGVWFTDDGRTWSEASGPFDETVPLSVASVDGELLMIGSANEDGRTLSWRSEDGASWMSEELVLPVSGDAGHISEVATFGDGLMAVGSISRGGDGPAAPAVWRSGDGVAWSCHLLDAAGFRVLHASTLTRAGTSWLATGGGGDGCGFGASCPGVSLSWGSADGLTWSRAAGAAEPTVAGTTDPAGAADGFLGVSHGATWLSPDATSWMRLSEGETSGELAGQVDAVTLTDDGQIVVAGTTYDANSDAGPWIAIGELSP